MKLEDRVYVDTSSDGGFVYVRYRGGVEEALTEQEVEGLRHEWVFFYSDDALAQVRNRLGLA